MYKCCFCKCSWYYYSKRTRNYHGFRKNGVPSKYIAQAKTYLVKNEVSDAKVNKLIEGIDEVKAGSSVTNQTGFAVDSAIAGLVALLLYVVR